MESQTKELSQEEQYRRFYERFSVASPGFLSSKGPASRLAIEVAAAVRSLGLVRIGGEQTVEEITSLLESTETRVLWRTLWEAGYRWTDQFEVDDDGAERVLTDVLEWLWSFPAPRSVPYEDGRPGRYYPDMRLVAAEDVRRRFHLRTTRSKHASTKFVRSLLSELAREIDEELVWRLWNGSGQESLTLFQEAINMLLDGVREVTKDRPRTETRLDALAKTLKAPGSASKADGVDESL